MLMPPWRLRDFHDDDLDQAISVWDQSREPTEAAPAFPVSEVVSAARSGQPAVVAVVADQLVGMAVAQISGDRAWITMIALSSGWRHRGIGSALLALAKASRPLGFSLFAFQRNTPARLFYERRGFVAVAFSDGSGNEEGEPDVLYEWRPSVP